MMPRVEASEDTEMWQISLKIKIEADLKMQLTIHGIEFGNFCWQHCSWSHRRQCCVVVLLFDVLSYVDALSHLLVIVVLLCYVSFCYHCSLYSYSTIIQNCFAVCWYLQFILP